MAEPETSQFISLWREALADTQKTPRNQEIVLQRLGFQAAQQPTMQAVAGRYGISRERVRQIEGRVWRQVHTKMMWDTNAGRDTPATRLRAFLQANFDAEDDDVLTELILDFVLDGFPEPSQKLAVTVITRLTSSKRRKHPHRERLRTAHRRLKQRKRYPPRYLPELFEWVIWPDNPRTWQKAAFAEKQPYRIEELLRVSEHSGTFWSDKLQREVYFTNRDKKTFFQRLEAWEEVVYYLEYPFHLEYLEGSQPASFVVDVFVLLKDGRGLAVDLERIFDMGLYKTRTRWQSLGQYCKNKGMGLLLTDGRISLQQVQRTPVDPIYEADLLNLLTNKPILSWPDYEPLKDRYSPSGREFAALVIKHKLIWQRSPFVLSYPQSDISQVVPNADS